MVTYRCDRRLHRERAAHLQSVLLDVFLRPPNGKTKWADTFYHDIPRLTVLRGCTMQPPLILFGVLTSLTDHNKEAVTNICPEADQPGWGHTWPLPPQHGVKTGRVLAM